MFEVGDVLVTKEEYLGEWGTAKEHWTVEDVKPDGSVGLEGLAGWWEAKYLELYHRPEKELEEYNAWVETHKKI